MSHDCIALGNAREMVQNNKYYNKNYNKNNVGVVAVPKEAASQ